MARRGFTLLELVIVIGIIGVLTGVAARQLLSLRVEAERAALTQVVGGLQNAVALEALSLITRGLDQRIPELVEVNPMTLLLQTPWTYLGEFDDPDTEVNQSGRWYFDRRDKLLVYRVRNAGHFESDLEGPARARFRITLVWNDENGNGRYDPSLDRIAGAQLQPVEPWQWRGDAARKSRTLARPPRAEPAKPMRSTSAPGGSKSVESEALFAAETFRFFHFISRLDS